MIDFRHFRPLHDRIIVERLVDRDSSSMLIIVRENPALQDFVGQGENGEHNDNRRVGTISRVMCVGKGVFGIQKGDVIMHSDWNDLPAWIEAPNYAMIREADVMGHIELNAQA